MASDHPFLSAEQLTLVAFLKAKPSHGEELGQRLLTLFEKARAEEGCDPAWKNDPLRRGIGVQD